jgi:c-di-GMP-related signal transduction protein
MAMDSSQVRMLHNTILVAITLQLSLVLPKLTHLIHHYYMKEPYHTSILSGYAWLQELLHGHPEHICTEIGVDKEVFLALVAELQSIGHGKL